MRAPIELRFRDAFEQFAGGQRFVFDLLEECIGFHESSVAPERSMDKYYLSVLLIGVYYQ
jgi:hypothetical protein